MKIGYKKRIIIVSAGFVDMILINPEIVGRSGEYETEEGCLSLDGVRRCTRYQNIEVEYTDSSWKKQKLKLSGWPAQICQHEIDHLNGHVYTEFMEGELQDVGEAAPEEVEE